MTIEELDIEVADNRRRREQRNFQQLERQVHDVHNAHVLLRLATDFSMNPDRNVRCEEVISLGQAAAGRILQGICAGLRP